MPATDGAKDCVPSNKEIQFILMRWVLSLCVHIGTKLHVSLA